MTFTARKVLDDLKKSYELLELESDEQTFRILWVASSSLTRTVGHVLDKVDKKVSIEMKLAISKAYQEWKSAPKENQIFFDFIENERNAVLKEYEFGFLSGPIDIIVPSNNEIFSLDENLFCPMSEGSYYAGEDCRDVLKMAIEWWECQLNAIESSLA